MRLFITLFLLSAQAYALDVCSFEETSDLKNYLESRQVRPVHESSDPKKFNSVERRLIHKTITLERRSEGPEQSLQIFGDFIDGEPGYNAGEIIYYNFDGFRLILVHYWPGDNEYGAYFKINKNGSFKLLAEIHDSFIECK